MADFDPSQAVGMGYCSPPIEGCEEQRLWDAMISKIKGVASFLPVAEVHCEDKPEFVWRSMVFVGPGPMNGTTMVENIYSDRSTGEIRFVVLDPAGHESDEEIINVLLKNPLRIEYYKRSRASKQRVHFPAPQASVVDSINKTVALAKSD